MSPHCDNSGSPGGMLYTDSHPRPRLRHQWGNDRPRGDNVDEAREYSCEHRVQLLNIQPTMDDQNETVQSNSAKI